MKSKRPPKAPINDKRYAVLVASGHYPTDVHDWLSDETNVQGNYQLLRKRVPAPASIAGLHTFEQRVEASFTDPDTAMRFKLAFGGAA